MASPDRTAKMTANNAPAPNVVAASSENAGSTDAYRAFDKTVSSIWQVAAGATGTLSYDFGSETWVADGYSLTALTGNRAPKDWTFEGSHDNAGWTTLDTQTGVTFTDSQTKSFAISNGAKWRYYRLNVTANGGSSPLELDEMTIQSPNNAGSYAFFL